MIERKLAIISMSGGLDSATLCAEALYQGYDVFVVNFNYNQKNFVEMKAFENLVKYFQEEYISNGKIIGVKKLNLKPLFDEFLNVWAELRDNGKIEKESHHQFYTPSRNLLFSVISAVIGEIIALVNDYNEVNIGLGIHKHSEEAYGKHRDYWDITPKFAETGFGYIEGRIEDVGFKEEGMDVVKFHEKPDIDTAKNYLSINSKSLNLNPKTYYFWNSGMFMFKAGVFLEELKKYAPKIYEACKIASENKKIHNLTLRIQHSHMEAIPDESIDYAVMEKSSIVKVIPSDIGWSDVGSFDALYEELPKDNNANTLNPNHIAIDSKNNLIHGNERKIATIDIEDCIIVDTGDALLVSKKGSSQKVKQVVSKLKEQNSELHNIHLTGYRPWGTYTVLEDTQGYKIKRIVVKPGKRLSLQKHFHRNEHWIVVSGTATVTVADEKKYVRPNESTYIKMGEVHRLENEGKIPVVMIEVQVGEYTGEDDIVRIEDDFKRG